MNAGHEFESYGNQDLPKGNPERPLVTFAVLTYNQEKYIREAVEGAFSQNYSPLEILLSDDCSSDSTFRIIRELASAYRGDHRIVINRNPANLNIGGHVKKIADIAKGEIIVMAAGDDVSKSDRVGEHVRVYGERPKATAVFSPVVVLGSLRDGAVQGVWGSTWLTHVPRYYLVGSGGGVGFGAAYSYRREVFFEPYPYPEFYNIEDRILPLRASFIGHVYYFPRPLVKYRVIADSASKAQGFELARVREDFQAEVGRTIQFFLEQGAVCSQEAKKLMRLADRNPRFWKSFRAGRREGGISSAIAEAKGLIERPRWFGRKLKAKLLRKFF
jgi:glycosyltransferase involved in cell wall biosynthesis